MSMRKLLVVAAPALVVALASTAFAQGPKLGKPISQEDLASWDISIGPDGAGLPAGSGTVKQGEATFAAKCQPCHNEKGAGNPNDRLVGGQGTLAGDKPPIKTVGGTEGNPHPVQKAFIQEQAFQCGYCLNGWVLTAKALLDKNPHPSDEEMRNAFESLVCRCGSHVRIFEAVRHAVDEMKRSA